MTAKDPALYLSHILESMGEIEAYTDGMSETDFLHDRKTQNAVIRLIEVIGEATKNLPDTFREQHPEVPWQDLAGMRDVLIHAYHLVDLAIVWNVVQNELPDFEKKIRKLMP